MSLKESPCQLSSPAPRCRSPKIPQTQTGRGNTPLFVPRHTKPVEEHIPTAIVYCEANFGAIDGKTANGFVRHSQKYRILSVIDSEKAGLDAGMADKQREAEM